MASSFKLAALDGDDCDVRYYTVKAAQTFVAGDLVYFDSNGELNKCGADPSLILGIALADAATGLATAGSIFGGSKIPVQLIDPAQPYFMSSTTTPAASNIGTSKYGIADAGSGVWQLDTSDTTNKRVSVIGISNSPLQEGFVVKFSPAYLQASLVTL